MKLNVGDKIEFGAYVQDRPYGEDTDPITWTVLDVQDGRALILAEKCIENVQYNKELVPSTWATCTLRQWFNGDFYESAFTPEEQAQILEVTLTNPGNKQFNTEGCEDTVDRIFALSIDELEKYLPEKKDRLAPATELAKTHNTYVYPDTGNAIWWLRSPGCNNINASRVTVGGSVCGLIYDDARPHRAVRPAMWIKTD